MRDYVLALLTEIGVTGAEKDPVVTLALDNAHWKIKNLTNLSDIPEGLEGVAVNIAVGEYLRVKKAAGQLDMEGLDLTEAVVKSLQEGDTNVSYAVGEGSQTPEQRLDGLIDYLTNGRTEEIYRYRRLVW